ncbi:ParB/RepB/Spo0J family partition protein [Schlesneria paludicola]|uniref:ParB/RepB/Spo0J family partition protein n=1 Tax=Schlesneria paludicola TaxID=360056 RepID=UPI00029B0340|nr:ParB/RepB/Spo0J family partition protein [Schlesneria paludicola]
MDEQLGHDQVSQEPSRRRLGRGLNALLGTAPMGGTDEASAGDQTEISVELIERNPFQPRQDFDQTALNELVDSIRQHGVLQPLLVRPAGDGYQLIAGERRLISAKKAGLRQVPCRVLNLTDQQVSEVALEENLKRQDLNVLEKAIAFQDYLKRFGCTIEDLARRLSFERSTVSNMLRLLELPEAVKTDLRSDKISAGHARAILALKNVDAQVSLSQRIQQENLSVRKTEEAVREMIATKDADVVPFQNPDESNASADTSNRTSHVVGLQNQLRDWLGTNVEIKLSGKAKDKGKIVIDFASNDDFERIVGKLQRAA